MVSRYLRSARLASTAKKGGVESKALGVLKAIQCFPQYPLRGKIIRFNLVRARRNLDDDMFDAVIRTGLDITLDGPAEFPKFLP